MLSLQISASLCCLPEGKKHFSFFILVFVNSSLPRPLQGKLTLQSLEFYNKWTWTSRDSEKKEKYLKLLLNNLSTFLWIYMFLIFLIPFNTIGSHSEILVKMPLHSKFCSCCLCFACLKKLLVSQVESCGKRRTRFFTRGNSSILRT